MSLEEYIGQKLKNDVATLNGLVLIPSGTTLQHIHLKLLQQHRIRSEDMLFLSNEPERDTAAELMKQATSYAKDIFHRVRTNRKVPILEIKHELIPMIQEVSEIPNLFGLVEAVKAKDEYTHQHNIGVGVLSTMLGKWLGLETNEMMLLSLAATLHDVGKVRISDDILMKPGKLTEEEYQEMKRHTIYGYEMLKEAVGLNPRVAHVALQHHEREDGNGYPLKLGSHQLDPISRIVAVADIFHAMSSTRPYHEALPFHQVVSQMKQGYFGNLDPNIVAVFLRNMVRSMIGKQVRLTDGRYGEVVYINPHDDTNPLVKVKESFIDLSREKDIQIHEVLA